jgi:hypothetical protein
MHAPETAMLAAEPAMLAGPGHMVTQAAVGTPWLAAVEAVASTAVVAASAAADTAVAAVDTGKI